MYIIFCYVLFIATLPSQPNQLIPWRQIHPRLVTQCGGLVVLGIYSSSGDYKEVTNYNLPSFLTQDSLGSTPITLSGSKLNDIKTFFGDQNLEWIRILEKCPTKSCLNDIVFNIGYQGYYHVDEQQGTRVYDSHIVLISFISYTRANTKSMYY